jgi:hypothetical protein
MYGHAISQVDSYWLLTANAWFHSQGSANGVCGEEYDTVLGQVYLQILNLFPVNYHSSKGSLSSPWGGGGGGPNEKNPTANILLIYII